MRIDEIKDYIDQNINLGDYDLGGVEITEEDYEAIRTKIEEGEKLEKAVESYLIGIRNVLDEGLE